MIKKEIIQAFRNKFNIFLLFIFPLVSITCMGFALKDLMEGELGIFKDKNILYSVKGEGIENKIYEEGIKNICNNLGVDLFKITNQNDERFLKEKRRSIFLILKNGEISYTEGEDELLNSIFSNYLKEFILNIEVNKNSLNINGSINEIKSDIKEIKVDRGITSFHYYGFVQIALIIMYLSLTLGESMGREREEETLNRVIISKANTGYLIVSKLVVGIIIGTVQLLEGVIFTKLFLKIDWGIYIKEMIILLLIFVVLCSLFGVVMGLLIKEGKTLSTVINTVIIMLGVLGGAYLPLSLIKSLPFIGSMCKISPVYWVNEALLNLSVGINGKVVNTAYIYLVGLIFILALVYLVYEGVFGGLYD